MSIEILPQLIREKLEYYRYYVPHKAKMYELNKEYFSRIVTEFGLRLCTSRTNPIHYYNQYVLVYIMYNRRDMKQYTSKLNICGKQFPFDTILLPKLYFYSSGLNNPNGYF